jgi:uncharacterized protein YjbJ (UPF0337 family)
VAERLKAPVLKTGNGQPFVGSNPTPSASLRLAAGRRRSTHRAGPWRNEVERSLIDRATVAALPRIGRAAFTAMPSRNHVDAFMATRACPTPHPGLRRSFRVRGSPIMTGQYKLHWRIPMNTNQIKGKAKDIGGKIQENFGKATGSTEQQAKGLAKQVEGKVQKGAGDIQDAAEKAEKKTR